jgi:hypothetical protein
MGWQVWHRGGRLHIAGKGETGVPQKGDVLKRTGGLK